jgi:hypothetical protein
MRLENHRHHQPKETLKTELSHTGKKKKKLKQSFPKPRKKEKEKRDSKDPNKSLPNPATTQVIDSSPSSPQPSSSKFSSITKDIAMATRRNMVVDGNLLPQKHMQKPVGIFGRSHFRQTIPTSQVISKHHLWTLNIYLQC